MKNSLVFLRNTLLLAVILLAACSKSPEKVKKAPEKKEPLVKVMVVQKTDLATFADLTGTIRPNISSDVSSPVEGVLEKLFVRENSLVKKNELVGIVSSNDRNALIASNQLKIKEIEAQLGKADQASPQYTDIQQQLAKARKDYEYALSMYQTYPVVAPMSGMVTKRFADQGSLLSARQPFITITDMSSQVVKVELNEQYFSKVRQDEKVNVNLNAYPGKMFPGVVSLINPEINQTSRTVMLDIKLNGQSVKLLTGMMAEIKFPVDNKKNILAIPNDAVLTKPSEEKFVYTVRNGLAEEHVLKIGMVSEKLSEVVDGLQPGDSLIVMGQQMVKNGIKVKAIPNPVMK